MKKLLKILLAIVAVLLITMFVLGKKYHYEKSIVINAPIERVYGSINSMRGFNQWNPWMKLDPNMKVTYSGNMGTIGDKYCWDSKIDDAGAGCQEITNLVPNEMQSTRMVFERPQKGEATSNIKLQKEGNATKVTWDMDTEMEYPTNLMKPLMDYWMGKSYTEGLNNLKTLSEK